MILLMGSSKNPLGKERSLRFRRLDSRISAFYNMVFSSQAVAVLLNTSANSKQRRNLHPKIEFGDQEKNLQSLSVLVNISLRPKNGKRWANI